MQYIKGIENYKNDNKTAITLGKFDGLHQGHELLISRVIEHQKQDDVDSVVFAFDMSSLYQMQNKDNDFLLTNEEKAAKLDGRIDYFIDCPFGERISQMDAKKFIKEVLVETFHAKYIVIGTDFRFGHNRCGDAQMLRLYSGVYGYEVEVFDKKKYHGREISSTYIKEELKKGNIMVVEELLGYEYHLKRR